MAGRFDQYVGTSYIPLPFEDILKAGASKQQRYNIAREQEDQSDLLFRSINAIPEHRAEKEALYNKYNTELEKIKANTLDKSDYDYQLELKKLANKFTKDEDRIALEGTFKNAQDYYEHTKQLGDKADPYTYNPLRDYIKSGVTDKGYNFRDPNSGQLKPFTYSGQKQSQDFTKRFQDMIGKISESGVKLEKAISTDENGNVVWKTEGQSGVDINKIQNIVGNQMNLFLKTKEGEYYIDKLRAQNPNISNKELSNTLFKDFVSVALPQVGNKYESSYDRDFVPGWYAKDKQQEQVEYDPMQAVKPEDNVQDVNAPNKIFDNIENIILGSVPANQSKIGTGVADSNFKLNKDQLRLYEKAASVLGKNASSDIDRAKIINDYLDMTRKESINPKIQPIVDPKQAEALNLQFFGTKDKGSYYLHNKQLKKIAGKGDNEVNGTDFLDKFGNKDDYKINVSGKLTPDNPWYSSGHEIVVSNKDGEEVARYAVKGAISSDPEKNLQLQYLHDMYKAKYNVKRESEIRLPDISRTFDDKAPFKTYKVDYVPIYGNTLDKKGHPNKIGEKARLLYDNGEVVTGTEVQDSQDAIGALYNLLSTEYFNGK